MRNPIIIQGGMGVAVSAWPLARAVALHGQLGVISGTGIEAVVARRLQLGDIGGNLRRAMEHFPVREMAERVMERYFVPGGKAPDAPFKARPQPNIKPTRALLELTVISNFVEVFLAKEGHNGLVGINLLTKIQLPTLPSLFGAMLAGVDYVLMGAGIPRAIPTALDRLAALETTSLAIDVTGALPGEEFVSTFEPTEFASAPLKRPNFLPIVSSATLATSLLKKSGGSIEGFVIEGPTAGGHNAPPRGAMQLDEFGEPIYGPRDVPDLAAFRDLGVPFWLAGSYAEPEKLREALAEGAAGVQLGTAFAFSNESGIAPEWKQRVIDMSRRGEAKVFTDPLASPTGFPFKVIQVPATISDAETFEARNRICDLGYLRTNYRTETGEVGYRCPAEPIDDFTRKGGELSETDGRKCVCNGLFSTIGLGQIRKDGYQEEPLLTAGNDVADVARFVPAGKTSYSAADVIAYVTAGVLDQPVDPLAPAESSLASV